MNIEKLHRCGQIKKGDALILETKSGAIISSKAKILVNASSQKEEVVYNKKKNFYFITSMVLDGSSWIKEVLVISSPFLQGE